MPFVTLAITANCEDLIARPSDDDPADANVYAAIAIGDVREAIATSHFIMRTGCLYAFNGTFHSDPGLVDLTSNELQVEGSQSPYISNLNVASRDSSGEYPYADFISRAISFGLGTSSFACAASTIKYSTGKPSYPPQRSIGCSTPINLGGAGYTLTPAYFSGTVSEYSSTTPMTALYRGRAYGMSPLLSERESSDEIWFRTPIPYLSARSVGAKGGDFFRMTLGGYQVIRDIPIAYRCWTKGLRMPALSSGNLRDILDLQTIDAYFIPSGTFSRQFVANYDVADALGQVPGYAPAFPVQQLGAGVETTFLATMTNTAPSQAPISPMQIMTTGNECYLGPYDTLRFKLPSNTPKDHLTCSQIVRRVGLPYDSSPLVLNIDNKDPNAASASDLKEASERS